MIVETVLGVAAVTKFFDVISDNSSSSESTSSDDHECCSNSEGDGQWGKGYDATEQKSF
jgi:hypothetical protein